LFEEGCSEFTQKLLKVHGSLLRAHGVFRAHEELFRAHGELFAELTQGLFRTYGYHGESA
jgi:hypothetical protein